jgi:acylphosphatase
MKAVTLRVKGDVQGVFYRHWAKDTAEKLGISGWTRNEQDGSVLIFAQGEPQDIESFVSWTHEGSPMSSVESVGVSEMEPDESTTGFYVK